MWTACSKLKQNAHFLYSLSSLLLHTYAIAERAMLQHKEEDPGKLQDLPIDVLGWDLTQSVHVAVEERHHGLKLDLKPHKYD
jgi:hypothetical protein